MSRSTRTFFTFSELIVIIGLLTALAGIMQPAVSKARTRALSIACGNNMKQLAYAAFLYQEDNNNYYTPSYYGLTDDEAIEERGTWDLKYGKYMGYAVNAEGKPVGAWPSLRCPVDTFGSEEFSHLHRRRSYGIINGFVNTVYEISQGSFYSRPYQIYFISEADYNGNTDDGYLMHFGPANRVGVTGTGQNMSIRNSRCLGANHGDRAWILYLDCHAVLRREWSFRSLAMPYLVNSDDDLRFADGLE